VSNKIHSINICLVDPLFHAVFLSLTGASICICVHVLCLVQNSLYLHTEAFQWSSGHVFPLPSCWFIFEGSLELWVSGIQVTYIC